jgi:hypothetical protein
MTKIDTSLMVHLYTVRWYPVISIRYLTNASVVSKTKGVVNMAAHAVLSGHVYPNAYSNE